MDALRKKIWRRRERRRSSSSSSSSKNNNNNNNNNNSSSSSNSNNSSSNSNNSNNNNKARSVRFLTRTGRGLRAVCLTMLAPTQHDQPACTQQGRSGVGAASGQPLTARHPWQPPAQCAQRPRSAQCRLFVQVPEVRTARIGSERTIRVCVCWGRCCSRRLTSTQDWRSRTA